MQMAEQVMEFLIAPAWEIDAASHFVVLFLRARYVLASLLG